MLATLLNLSRHPYDKAEIDNINLYALLYLIFGLAALILNTIQISTIGLVGEHITKKIRI